MNKAVTSVIPMNARRKAIILAAGEGSRLMPYTATLPKCLIPIGGRPLLDYWIDDLIEAGVSEIVINSHHHAEWTQKYIQRVSHLTDVKITEAHEPTLLGSAGTLRAVNHLVSDTDSIAIVYGDNFSYASLKQMWDSHDAWKQPITLMLFNPPDATSASCVVLENGRCVKSFEEKPSKKTSPFAFAGVAITSQEGYQALVSNAPSASDLGTSVFPCITNLLSPYFCPDTHIDIGNPGAMWKAHSTALKRKKIVKNLPASKATFFDRDGTLIENVVSLRDPDKVKLLPYAVDMVLTAKNTGMKTVLVTNQSALGDGRITKEDLERVHFRLQELLLNAGTSLDAVYYCPEPNRFGVELYMEHVDRKPGPGMFWQASVEHGIDLSESIMIGDTLSDVVAGKLAGCSTICVY